METFDSSWWIYYRDKMLFLFSSVQEKLYIFAKISHYLLVTIYFQVDCPAIFVCQ